MNYYLLFLLLDFKNYYLIITLLLYILHLCDHLTLHIYSLLAHTAEHNHGHQTAHGENVGGPHISAHDGQKKSCKINKIK